MLKDKPLVSAATKELSGLLQVNRDEAGMHFIGWLPKGACDKTASAKASARGVEAMPLSAFSSETLPRAGLVLGYTAFRDKLKTASSGWQRL